MSYFLSPVFNEATFNDNGAPGSGWTLTTDLAGTLTPVTVYMDSLGAADHQQPITLNARGEPPAPIWILGGQSVKFILKDADGVTIRTIDNVTGINDSTDLSPDEWQEFGDAPTYISATQFSLVGDQTLIFSVGRRVKSTITAGTGYHTITASSFGSGVTTVTVNGTALDSGLSAVSYGLLSPGAFSSVPSLPNVMLMVSSAAPSIIAGSVAIYTKLVSGITRIFFRNDGGSDQQFMFTGEIRDYIGLTAPTGWLLLSGLTIGDATSGGTARANADCEALFTLLYDSWADAEAAVSTGRGASAAADWAAHKTIALPDARGRVLAGQDDMGGTSANRLTGLTGGVDGDVIGRAGGGETQTLTIAQMPAHTHPPLAGTAIVELTGATNLGTSGPSPIANAAATTGSTGGGTAHNNVQPVLIVNKIIKL